MDAMCKKLKKIKHKRKGTHDGMLKKNFHIKFNHNKISREVKA
jgi:hypothetical protein